MKRLFLVAPLSVLVMAACGAASDSGSTSDGAARKSSAPVASAMQPTGQGSLPPDKAHINANIMSDLHAGIAGMHATWDGDPVTSLVQTGDCTATIATAKGSTAVDWRMLGNLAPRSRGKELTFAVPAGRLIHVLAVPEAEAGDHMNMALGVLDGNCSPGAAG